MSPTRRACALLGVLVGFAALALAWPVLLPGVIALDLAFAVLLVADFARTPAPSTLIVERSAPARVGLGVAFRRSIRLAHPSARALTIEIHEEYPPTFEVDLRAEAGASAGPAWPTSPTWPTSIGESNALDPRRSCDSGPLDADGRLTLERAYRAHLRGRFALGRLRIAIRGPLGLVERRALLHGDQPLTVEPALPNLGQTLALAASERWRDLGVRTLRARGGETEFESLREYVPGDDARRIDAKAWARRGKPIVREYEVERGQELFILVERGRRMRAIAEVREQRGWSKLDWALDAAIQLAAVALAKGDRVGVAAFDRRLVAYVAPVRGKQNLARLSQALFELQPSEEEGDLGRALAELATRHRRRATVLVIGDVADPLSLETQTRALASASRRHRIVFAALDDPDLRALVLDLSADPAERAAAFELVEDRRAALARCAASGARVLDALPAEAAAPLLAAWLEERRR